jgi:hypothetical protein
VSVQGTDALLREGDSLLVTLAHPYTVPATSSQLTFMYPHLSFDTTTSPSINDAFEAAFGAQPTRPDDLRRPDEHIHHRLGASV